MVGNSPDLRMVDSTARQDSLPSNLKKEKPTPIVIQETNMKVKQVTSRKTLEFFDRPSI